MSEQRPDAPLSVIIGGRKDPQQIRDIIARGPLSRSGGGGTGDGMEARIAKLEAGISHLERDVGEIRLDLREMRTDIRDARERLMRLEERVSHLPGKGFIVTSLLVTLAVVAGLVAFQNQIQTIVGNRPAASSTPANSSPP